jgi:hypothetical protein
MTKSNVMYKFVQRTFWFYIVEAVILLAILAVIRAHP